MIDIIKTIRDQKQKSMQDSANAIPPSYRFILKPDESDAFHSVVEGQEKGVYLFRFKISFHYGSEKAVRYSDRIYACFSAPMK
jgi:hypothetical protein